MNSAACLRPLSVSASLKLAAILCAPLFLIGCAESNVGMKPASAASAISAEVPIRGSVRVRTWFVEIDATTPRAHALVVTLNEIANTRTGDVSGLLSEVWAKAIWAELNSIESADVLTGVDMTVVSGVRSTGIIGQEMRYPTRWIADRDKSAWVPADFETRLVGLESEVAPVLLGDGRVNVGLRATSTELEGFVRSDREESAAMSAPADVVTMNGEVLKTEGPATPVFNVRAIELKGSLRPGAMLVAKVAPQVVASARAATENGDDERKVRASFIFVAASPGTPIAQFSR